MILKRIVLAALILLNLFLAYRLFLGDNGIQAYLELKDKNAEMLDAQSRVEGKSETLSQEIRMLKTDEKHLADTIRRRMNYVKDKEVLYLDAERTPQDQSRKAAGAGVDENEN
jgi:cell division protein FtsB